MSLITIPLTALGLFLLFISTTTHLSAAQLTTNKCKELVKAARIGDLRGVEANIDDNNVNTCKDVDEYEQVSKWERPL